MSRRKVQGLIGTMTLHIACCTILAALFTPGIAQPLQAQDESSLPPPGYGRFSREEISITIETPDLMVRITPLGAPVLSLLRDDAYRSFNALLTSENDRLSEALSRAGVNDPSILLVSFFGKTERARYHPDDVNVLSSGGFGRPATIVPLSPRWSDQELTQRETRLAIYVMDASVDLLQPFTVTYGTYSDDSWASRLPRIEDELARARGRAAAAGND